MKSNKHVTLDQIFEISQPQLIRELMAAGLSSEKAPEAILILKDEVTALLISGLKKNKINDLVLLLSGSCESSSKLKITEEFKNMFTLRSGLGSGLAIKASHQLLLFALRSVGEYLPTSYLNKSGITSLLNCRPTRKLTLPEQGKSSRFNGFLSEQFKGSTQPKVIYIGINRVTLYKWAR